MGIKKDFIRRTTPDKELEKEIQQMLKSMNRYATEHVLDEMIDVLDETIGDTFSDTTEHSSKRITKLAPFIKLGSLILAFILFVILALVIFHDTPTDSKQTTPPTIEQKSTQETPDVFKKL
jgi:large-conductance mechanosensitive channel